MQKKGSDAKKRQYLVRLIFVDSVNQVTKIKRPRQFDEVYAVVGLQFRRFINYQVADQQPKRQEITRNSVVGVKYYTR